jgi:L-glyceraldehyde 3-phosphate reductase
MLNRWVEEGLLDVLRTEGIGCIAFSPLAQGVLTGRYLDGIPPGSRASRPGSSLRPDSITPQRVAMLRTLNGIAKLRGQTLAQLALAWVLRHDVMTSAVIGASTVKQLEENVAALNNLECTKDELLAIGEALSEGGPG